MEPIPPTMQEKEKLPEIRKPVTPRGAVFPILIVLAMLFLGGTLFFSLRTQEPDIVPDVVQLTQSTCIDSDPENDIYTKGIVVTSGGGQRTVYDYCSGTGQQVSEMWCYESPKGSGNYVNGNMVYDCPNGCLDGKCIQDTGTATPQSEKLRFAQPPHVPWTNSFCLGEFYTFFWEGSEELSTVSIWVRKGTTTVWAIQDSPATTYAPGKGTYDWKIGISKNGAVIPEGRDYTLGISGRYPSSMHKTDDSFEVDKPISLVHCPLFLE